MIAEQIERAAAETNNDPGPSTQSGVEEGLKRDENTEKVVLSLSMKPAVAAAPTAPTGFKMNPLKPVVNPLKANPLKRPNVFKSATPASSTDNGEKTGNEKKRSAAMSAAERLIIEEQERKRRRMDRDNP